MLYCDLSINGTVIWVGQVCINLSPIADYPSLGFQGTLRFQDTLTNVDPMNPGLGTQFVLWYLDPLGNASTIPLLDTYSQQFSVVLYNQNCSINLYQKP
jgi:hypothetical protein